MKLLLLELSDEDVDNRGFHEMLLGILMLGLQAKRGHKISRMLVFMDEKGCLVA